MNFSAFSETQHNSAHALSASKAYSEIIEALQNASSAAEKAQESANQAQQLVDRSSADSTVNLANATLAISHKLEETVLNAENKDEYMIKTNNQLKQKLDELKALALKGNENITRIKEAQNILEDHNDRINNVKTIVEDAEKETNNAGTIVNEFVEKVEALNNRVKDVNSFNNQNINEQIANGLF